MSFVEYRDGGRREGKYYAPNVGNVLTADETTGERTELVQIIVQ